MLKNLLNRFLTTPPPAPPVPAPALAPAPTPEDVACADALIAQGNDQEDAGRLVEAEALYRSAVAAAPLHPRAHLNLGIALAAKGDEDGAARAYEAVLAIAPDHPFGNYNYARLAFLRGDYARAEALVGAALRAKPEFPQALVVQSNVLDLLGKTEPAVAAMEAALRLQPDDAGAWFNLGVLLQRSLRPDDARAAVDKVLAREPGHLGALVLLSRVLRDQGFAAEALAAVRTVIESDPADWANRSFELLMMNFLEGLPADALFRRHVEFGADMERAFPARFDRFPERGDPQRRLRVGYVSGDIHLHPVTFFLVPLLEHHDRSRVEVFCYSYGAQEDDMTRRVRGLCDQWRPAASMSDTQLADAIHADAIDVLVDLTGHAGAQPRLPVFCQRPAPVQVAWVGYLNTTGLTRMDFRVSDRRTDPLETSQPLHTERLVHLPESQWCYRPVVDAQIDPVAPFERNGYVTFGSFNAALKITSTMCRRWGEVMARLPGSRLVVADVKLESKRAAIRSDLAALGIAGDRVEFMPRVTLDKYLAVFNKVDVSLDTVPYGGGTTTFDSLWMGVPVVATIGDTPVARSAASVLAYLGLDDWIAPSIADYVDVAVARASDREALLSLRRGLRARLQASPLTDLERFARDLESAYRDMWNARTG